MPTVDEELTKLLQDRADRVPVDSQLLSKVQARSRRIAVRQRIGVAVAVAAAVAVVAAVPSVIRATRNSSAPVVANSGKPTTGPTPETTDDFLVKAPAVTPTFPMTPSYLPPGLPKRSIGMTPGDLLQLVYTDGQPSSAHGITLEISPQESNPTGEASEIDPNLITVTAVRVRGQPGTMHVAKDGSIGWVQWQRKPGQWASVAASGRWSNGSTLLRVAQGLRDKPLGGTPVFTVALAPRGYQLVLNEPYGVTLAGPDAPDQQLAVYAVRSNPLNGAGRPVTVGKNTGWLAKRDGEFLLVVRISASTYLSVTAPAQAAWNEDRLTRFAAGVEYLGPQPPPGQ